MLPLELTIELSGYLDIHELVALSHTCKRWKTAITDSVFQLVMMRHCPSFSPEMTSRQSWEECAKVHVARSKNPRWVGNMNLFSLREAVPINVSRNVPVPTDFVSCMDCHKAKLGKGCGPIEYHMGNGVAVNGTRIYLGSHELGKRLGVELLLRKPIVTSGGTSMFVMEPEEWVDRRLVKTETSIGLTNFSYGDYGNHTTRIAVKLNSEGEEPDIGLVFEQSDHRHRAYPLMSANKASVALLFRAVNDPNLLDRGLKVPVHEKADVSFLNVYGKDQMKRTKEVTLDWEDSDELLWYDGLILRLRPGKQATLRCYRYDLEEPLQHFDLGLNSVYGAFMSPDLRYAMFLDENQFVSKIWDLKTGHISSIVVFDRRAITMVGHSKGELLVRTYDADFIKSNIPEFLREEASLKDFEAFSSRNLFSCLTLESSRTFVLPGESRLFDLGHEKGKQSEKVKVEEPPKLLQTGIFFFAIFAVLFMYFK
ncbi:hypothetical protein CJU89_4950 [Yarrowia sp. B02]|nr:hypothetical protein CJU89_4950 [Yarrowia sp. B02]